MNKHNDNNQPEPQIYNMPATKLKILGAALDLFSTQGYAHIGIRDIARAVGIKSSSIYNHFASKDDILAQIYQFFYDNFYSHLPALETILDNIPNIPVYDSLLKLLPPCEEEKLYDLIQRIVVIAAAERNHDPRANQLVMDISDNTADRIAAVIGKMTDLHLIEPLDIPLFTSVFLGFSLSTTVPIDHRHTLTLAEWKAGRRMILRIVTPKQ